MGTTVRSLSLHTVYKVVLPFLYFSGTITLKTHLHDLDQPLMPLKDISGLRVWPMLPLWVFCELSENYKLSIVQGYLYLTWFVLYNIPIIHRRLGLGSIQYKNSKDV